MTWKVAALYRFVRLEDVPTMQKHTKAEAEKNGIVGTLLLAPEGINGTIAGPEEGLDAIIAYLDDCLGVTKGELKYSTASERPFRRLKVRKKKEIVTLRQDHVDPTNTVGTYVDPEEWNTLLADNPDMVVIDTRNTYETAVGMFDGATDPETECFVDFPDYVKKNLDPAKNKKIAMYCTGGIRCEKASSYMLAEGFEEVYHLKGGILKYLETIPADESKWKGDCFVFDRRVAVGQDLEEAPYLLCYGCRMPLSEEDTLHADYEKGVSCHHCKENLTDEKAHAFRMRHDQMKARGESI